MATENRDRFPRVPYYAIERHLMRVHIGTPDSEVIADLRSACAGAKAPDGAGCTPEEEAEAIRYGLECHRDNQRGYLDVMYPGYCLAEDGEVHNA